LSLTHRGGRAARISNQLLRIRGEFHFASASRNKGKDTKLIVMSGSLDGRPQAEATYKKLASGYTELQRTSAEYYGKYLNETLSVNCRTRKSSKPTIGLESAWCKES